jgi:two-component system sensor histidine kinase KdpD
VPDEPSPSRPAPGRVTVGFAIRAATFAAALLAATTVVIALLESEAAGELDGSPLYLVAVVIVASRYRTAAGIATALAAFLVYNLLFTEPRFTLAVADPTEWLNLVLFLFVAVVIGRLTGVIANEADEAEARAREAKALYGIAHAFASETSEVALAQAVRHLVSDAGMTRVWVMLEDAGRDRLLADSGGGPLPSAPPTVQVLMREGTEPHWMGTHAGRRPDRPAGTERWYRVRLGAGGPPFGSLWATRPAAIEPPDRIETRLLLLAADQVALAMQRDALRAQAVEAEVAHRDAALKSALVDSVSHDLRTPLAGIRAAAGSIADPDTERSPEEVRATATSIEAEAIRLDRMVGALLDLSRIQAGAIHARREALDVEDAAGAVVARLRPLLGERTVQVAFGEDLPPVEADPIFLDQCLGNLIENATRHTPPTSTVTLRAASAGDRVVIEVEDDGPGVPDEVAGRLFDRFYRGARGPAQSGGMGVGLTIVRGLAEAMGGQVDAARGTAGGLLVRLTLPAAPRPADEATA